MADVIITPASGIVEFLPSGSTINKIEASGNTFNLINTANATGVVFNIEASNGSLFSVVDSLSGSLMSVNNNAGLPVLEVFSDDSIVGGRFGQNDFVVSSGGDVGIGTAAPSGKLHVAGDQYNNGTIYLHNTSSAGTSSTYNYISTDTSDNLRFRSGSCGLTLWGQSGRTSLTSYSSYIDIGNAYDAGGNSYIVFNPANIETMKIIKNKVGIGGSFTPASTLALQKSYTTAYAGNHTTITDNGIDIYNDQNTLSGTAFAGISFRVKGAGYGNAGAGSINLVNTGDGDGDLTFITRNNGTSSEKLRIAYDGKVGIGTSSPSTKLHVDGDLTLEAGGGTATIYVDYLDPILVISPPSYDSLTVAADNIQLGIDAQLYITTSSATFGSAYVGIDVDIPNGSLNISDELTMGNSQPKHKHMKYVVRKTTTDNTSNQVLTLDGATAAAGNSLVLPATSHWTYKVYLSAYNATDNKSAMWEFSGGIRRNNANSTAIIAAAFNQNMAESGFTGSATTAANDTLESLEVRCTGMSGKTINWTATVEITQTTA